MEDDDWKAEAAGAPGEEVSLHLMLRVVADVGIVGFPNAGKSSLLAAITRLAIILLDYFTACDNDQVDHHLASFVHSLQQSPGWSSSCFIHSLLVACQNFLLVVNCQLLCTLCCKHFRFILVGPGQPSVIFGFSLN